MTLNIEASWKEKISKEFQKSYFKELIGFINEEYTGWEIYPPENQIFNAFEYCNYHNVRVVIIGQDPYHGVNQGNGLCFSVNDGIRKPPSLVNIFKERQSDLGKPIPESGNLESWAKQGVLLLNATLTVRANSPGSHQNKGWETFTDSIINLISEEKENIVFILWGTYAKKKGEMIDRSKHLVLESAHPSPFATRKGFFGSKPFSKANEYLKMCDLKEIDW